MKIFYTIVCCFLFYGIVEEGRADALKRIGSRGAVCIENTRALLSANTTYTPQLERRIRSNFRCAKRAALSNPIISAAKVLFKTTAAVGRSVATVISTLIYLPARMFKSSDTYLTKLDRRFDNAKDDFEDIQRDIKRNGGKLSPALLRRMQKLTVTIQVLHDEFTTLIATVRALQEQNALLKRVVGTWAPVSPCLTQLHYKFKRYENGGLFATLVAIPQYLQDIGFTNGRIGFRKVTSVSGTAIQGEILSINGSQSSYVPIVLTLDSTGNYLNGYLIVGGSNLQACGFVKLQ